MRVGYESNTLEYVYQRRIRKVLLAGGGELLALAPKFKEALLLLITRVRLASRSAREGWLGAQLVTP
jgi:hypothetical protein